MMAAVQPFLSGAISKTVNMPEDATVEDIQEIYLRGWEMGLKAIAIYRDGSKRSQPLSTTRHTASVDSTEVDKLRKQVEGLTEQLNATQENKRRKLPMDRDAKTHKFSIGGHEGYLTVGLYEDGTPGEIFLRMSKEGSTLSGLMDAFATSISICLQYGVPLDDLVNKFSHMKFEPNGFTGNSEIPMAKSIIDYIFRWLGARFLGEAASIAIGNQPMSLGNGFAHAEEESVKHTVSVSSSLSKSLETFVNSEDAPPCSDCGAITVRNGSCYKCMNCGATTGCS
jgi:ribonucleoside-diphosphate reductase alpha chain